MGIFIQSDESFTDPIPGTPLALPVFDVSYTTDLYVRWSARTFEHAGTENGAAVGTWPSYQREAGDTLTLSQSIGDRQPTLVTEGIGGRAAISFDNLTDDSMEVSFGEVLPTPFTVFLVISPVAIASENPNIFSGFDDSYYCGLYHTLGGANSYATQMGSVSPALETFSNAASATPQIVVLRLGSGVANGDGIWVSAHTANRTGQTTTTDVTPKAALGGIGLGRSRASYTNATFKGLFSEFLLYNAALATPDVHNVMDELGEHYGITIGP